MNVILRSATLGKEEWRVPGNGGYCILAGMLGKKIEGGTFENTVEQNHKLLELARNRQF